MDILLFKKLSLVGAAVVMLFVANAFADAQKKERKEHLAPNTQESFRYQSDDTRQISQQTQDTMPRRGKLSPDERRELRRQIDEAGQDLYRGRR